MKISLTIFAIVAVTSVAATVYDKAAAKTKKRRIPEATLMLLGAAGGAMPMFITMKIIRHKTRHKKFMLGLPLLILLQAVIVAIIIINNRVGG